MLDELAAECDGDDCEGGCNHGWVEPLERGRLRSAYALERKGLVNLANGRHPSWTAGHVTVAGRRRATPKKNNTAVVRMQSFSLRVEGDAETIRGAFEIVGLALR